MEKNDDWYDLERFKYAGAKIGNTRVTISLRKSITLSAGFMHHAKNQVEGMTHMLLSFSKSKNAIVFEFTSDPKAAGAVKITMKGNSIISARSFFNYYRIDVEKAAGRYAAKLESIPNLGKKWVVYLDQKLK